MSDIADATLADCLLWSGAKWTDYPDHCGMVRVSIPFVGREEFRQNAIQEGWEEYSHLTAMQHLPSIIECGILLPSKSKNGQQLLHFCEWTEGPSSRLKHARFSETLKDNNWMGVEIRVVSPPAECGGVSQVENSPDGASHYAGEDMAKIIIHTLDI